MPSQKITVKDLEKVALAYEEAHVEEKKYSAIKNACKINLNKILKALKTDIIDVDKKAEKPLRVQKIYKRTIVYDISKLRTFLKTKGKKALKAVFKISVNNQGLEDLYSEGIVQYDEVQKCIESIEKKDQISVLRVKKDLKKEE